MYLQPLKHTEGKMNQAFHTHIRKRHANIYKDESKFHKGGDQILVFHQQMNQFEMEVSSW